MILRFVPHTRRAAYEAAGWICVGNGQRMGNHGYWSCLMSWPHEGEPAEPMEEAA